MSYILGILVVVAIVLGVVVAMAAYVNSRKKKLAKETTTPSTAPGTAAAAGKDGKEAGSLGRFTRYTGWSILSFLVALFALTIIWMFFVVVSNFGEVHAANKAKVISFDIGKESRKGSNEIEIPVGKKLVISHLNGKKCVVEMANGGKRNYAIRYGQTRVIEPNESGKLPPIPTNLGESQTVEVFARDAPANIRITWDSPPAEPAEERKCVLHHEVR